jgi:glutamate-1-semialdehyde 2,1-aminomutase
MDPYPVYARSGHGCRVTDVEGEERIDFINNYTALIRGHSDPDVTAAVSKVIHTGTAFSLPTEYDIRLAELLVDRIPAAEQVRFCNSGSEAVLLAIRAARAHTGRSKIAKFEGCYHGIYDYAQASDSSRPGNWGELDSPQTTLETSMVPNLGKDVVTLPWNRPQICAQLIEDCADELAAVLIDPLPAALGLLSPAEGFLETLRELTRELGVVLIFDEVMSFRIDYRGAGHANGITPDLMSMGKIIGGGFPVGAVAGGTAIMSVFDHRPGEKVHHGGTYNGNPVTMAAGYETMRLMTQNEYIRLAELGDTLRANLSEMLKQRGVQHQVTGRGSMFCLLLSDRRPIDFRELIECRESGPELTGLDREMLSRGVLLGSRGLFGVLSTPMGEAEIDQFIDALDQSLKALRVY